MSKQWEIDQDSAGFLVRHELAEAFCNGATEAEVRAKYGYEAADAYVLLLQKLRLRK